MSGIGGRVGGWWKAAAGCAICASLIAGVIEDARHWVWDRTVGLWSPDRAGFGYCLDRHLAAHPRPDPQPAFHVIVTIPRGDLDRSQFHLIERSLTRAYGETREAPVQVEAVACEGLQPDSGLTADALDLARTRAQALLGETGADVVVWGTVLVPGETLELRFTGRETVEKPADYSADRLVLAPDFGADLGALVASKALTSVRAVVGPTMDGQRARADLAIAITAPLIAALPPGLSDAARADLYLAHGLALSMAADLQQGAGRYDASTDMLGRARALYDPAVRPHEWGAASAALIGNRIYAAADLTGPDRAAALAAAVAELQGLQAEPAAAASAGFPTYLRSAEAGTLVMLAEVSPPDQAGSLLARASDLALTNIGAIDPEAEPLTLAREQIVYSMILDRHAQSMAPTDAAAALLQAQDAVRKALSLLAEFGNAQDRAFAEGWLAFLLQTRAQGFGGDARTAMLDEAKARMTAAADLFRAEGLLDRWAVGQGALGHIRYELGQFRDGAEGAAELHGAVAAYRAAQTVLTAEADLPAWASLEVDLVLAEEICSRNPACDARKAALQRAYDHAVAAEAAYARIGDEGARANAAVMADSLKHDLAE